MATNYLDFLGNQPASGVPDWTQMSQYGQPAAPMNFGIPGQTNYLAGLDGTSSPTLDSLSGAADGSTGSGGFMDWLRSSGALGSTINGVTTQGWASPAISAAGGIGSALMGMAQYGLAKQTLAQNQQQFAMNYANQQKLTNSQLSDRQAARVASNPTAYQSVGDYMKTYGV